MIKTRTCHQLDSGSPVAFWRVRLTLLMVSALTFACALDPMQRAHQTTEGPGSDPIVGSQATAAWPGDQGPHDHLLRGHRQRDLTMDLLLEGDAARLLGDAAEASRLYRQVLLLNPGHPMGQSRLGAIERERGHTLTVAEIESNVQIDSPTSIDAALERLRGVIAEDPHHVGARALHRRLEDVQTRLPRRPTNLADRFKEPVTLEFRDAPLRAVFDLIAKVSGLNIYFDKDTRLEVKATILVRDAPLTDALSLLLMTQQLKKQVLSDDTVLVYPNTAQKIKDYQALSVRAFQLAAADTKTVSATLKAILKVQDLVVDDRLGIIILRDTPETIRLAERLVALQDVSEPEVTLDVEVIEVKRAQLRELGVRWPSQLSLTPMSRGTGQLTLSDLRHMGSASLQAEIGSLGLHARGESQGGNILANPRIRVRNKEKARVLIGDRVPVITTTSTSTGFVSESVNYVDVGLKLEVEPTVQLDDNVVIRLNLEVSSLVREVLSKSGTLSYQIGTRSASTVLQLRHGETQVLAGLINDEDRSSANRVPGLGDLPVLGRLFGSHKEDTQRSEILLSVTPRVVRPVERPRMADAEFPSGTASHVGAAVHGWQTTTPFARLQPDRPASRIDVRTAQPAVVTQEKRSDVPAPSPGDRASPSKRGLAHDAPDEAARWTPRWDAPNLAKVGETFDVELWVDGPAPVSDVSVVIGFDPRFLQAVAIEEGEYPGHGGYKTRFTQRVDAVQGRVFASSQIARDGSTTGTDARNAGRLLRLRFRALRDVAATRVELLSLAGWPSDSTSPTPTVDVSIQLQP